MRGGRFAAGLASALGLSFAVLGGDHGGKLVFPIVDVDQLGMFGDVAEVRLALIEVLDQVVPEVPFPHDFAGRLAGRLDLHERVRQQVTVAGHLRPAAGGNRLLGGLAVPHDQQHVAIGQPRHVVVRKLPRVVELEVPDQLSVPGELLNPPADGRPGSEDPRVPADRAGTHQVAVIEQERRRVPEHSPVSHERTTLPCMSKRNDFDESNGEIRV